MAEPTPFSSLLQSLSRHTWSRKYWDGRPTAFLPQEESEDLLLWAVEEDDVNTLNMLVDEVGEDFMYDVAEGVVDYSFPLGLEWYITTTYLPLFLTITPSLFLSSPDLQDALSAYPSNLYSLLGYWKGMNTSEGREAIRAASDLFTAGTVDISSVKEGRPLFPVVNWRKKKKEMFLTATTE